MEGFLSQRPPVPRTARIDDGDGGATLKVLRSAAATTRRCHRETTSDEKERRGFGNFLDRQLILSLGPV